jgi:hypothetical protein
MRYTPLVESDLQVQERGWIPTRVSFTEDDHVIEALAA